MKNITPLILAFNEAPNIRRTLERLCWAEEIVVVDSFSTDETLEIVKSFPQARIVQRKFDSFAGQCNFGLEKVKTNWVLSLDADYVLSEELVDEIRRLDGGGNAAGYQVRFRYCIQGRPLRGSLYPPRTEGPVRMLSGWIDHDDRKPLERWFGEQVKYSGREARYLLETSNTELKMADRIRKKIILAPALVFFYTLLGKGLILNGWPGWFYVFQRTFVEILRSLRLIEEKLKREGKKSKCDVTTEATK
ncbi:MAG: glycosyltransferase family 2 protein [Verrucomicrobiota bacterium]